MMLLPGPTFLSCFARSIVLLLFFSPPLTGCGERNKGQNVPEPIRFVDLSMGPGEASADASSPGQGEGKRTSRSPHDSCRKLIDRACDFWGRFSQECIEARARVPKAPRKDVVNECEEILAFFEVTYAKMEMQNPCRILARRVCNTLGRRTISCIEARAGAKSYKKVSQRRACKGDLILWEARQLLLPR
jgi:hypothetical protein